VALDGERGVIVGDGVIFVSQDGGSSWKSITSTGEDQWIDVAAL